MSNDDHYSHLIDYRIHLFWLETCSLKMWKELLWNLKCTLDVSITKWQLCIFIVLAILYMYHLATCVHSRYSTCRTLGKRPRPFCLERMRYFSQFLHVVFFLIESFGNSTRIDYGTGHEFKFCAFLCCLVKLGVLCESDAPAIALRVLREWVSNITRTAFWETSGGQVETID